MLSKKLKQIVFQTIKSLPKNLRIAITLQKLNSLSYKKIAAIINCPVSTVRSRIFQAKKAINNKVQPLIKR